MKRIIFILVMTVCASSSFGQTDAYWTSLQTRVDQAIKNKNNSALMEIEPEYDNYFSDATHRTPEVKFDYVRFKIHLGYAYIQKMELDKAEEALLTAISLSENFPKARALAYSGIEHCYSYKAMEKEAHDNYNDAIQYSLLAISYAEMAGKVKRVVEQYIILGREYTYTQQFEKGRLAFADAERRMHEVPDSMALCAGLSSEKAQLEIKTENYSAAIQLLEQAYTLYSQSNALKKETRLASVARSLSNTYRFYLHNEEKASYWDAVIARQDSQKTDYPTTLNQSFLESKRKYIRFIQYFSEGKYSEEIAGLQEILQEVGDTHTADNQILMAECYYNIALCYLMQKQYTRAISNFSSAIPLYQSVGNRPSLVECYTYASFAYFHANNVDSALISSQQALSCAESIYDDESVKLAECHNNIANIYAFHKDTALAKEHLLQAIETKERDVRRTFSFLTSQERSKYWDKMQRDIINYQPFMLRFQETQSEYTDALYDIQLLTKGLLLQSDVELQLIANSSSSLQPLFREVMAIRKKLQQDDLPLDTITLLKQKAEKIERELTTRSKEAGDFLHFLDITHEDVKRHLSSRAIAVEFATFKYGKDSIITAAYLIKKEWEHVLVLPLFEERDITSLIGSEGYTISSINNLYDYHRNGQKLTQQIWGEIQKHIHSGDTVYFAPSGLLHQVSLESLPYDSSRSMADVYSMVRVSSTREIAKGKSTVPNTKAALYGGIYYSATPEAMAIEHEKYSRGSRGANYLPETKVEIDTIRQLLEDKKISVEIYTASAANEESFKALSGKKQNILHIATHGFYWPDTTAQKQQYFSHHTSVSIDPLKRCGLLFAGANTALSGHSERLASGVEDGILTAQEISTLDLREADIVALSACETARGDVSGEGVFGLQRAFKMAGAQTLLMAIWPVDDKATQLLMTSFYRNLNQGMSKRQAFRMAQQEVRSYTAEGTSSGSRGTSGKEKMLNKGKMGGHAPQPPKGGVESSEGANPHPYASPYYWAGFILLD